MEIGLNHTSKTIVKQHMLAVNVGSGDLEVLATPAMMALMENAAMMAVAPYLPDRSTTVGGFISSSHLRPTAEGKTVEATATLVKEEGRKLTFKVTACDEAGIIGEGEHIRFVVDRDRFMAKVNA